MKCVEAGRWRTVSAPGLFSPADFHHGLPAANRKGIADRDDQAGELLVVLGSQDGNNATVRRVCTSAQPPHGRGHTLAGCLPNSERTTS